MNQNMAGRDWQPLWDEILFQARIHTPRMQRRATQRPLPARPP